MSKSVAIVTGASQGIGQSTAIRLARDFGAIVLVARNRAKLEETAAAVQKLGAESLVIDLDLADRSAARNVVDTGWCAGEQRATRSGHDRAAALLPGALGAPAQYDRGGSDCEIPGRSRDFALRGAAGHCRTDGLPVLTAGAVDDRLEHPDGWW